MLKLIITNGLRLLALALLIVQTACTAPASPEEVTPVFILAGQSNMSGQSKMKDAPKGYALLPENVTFYDFTQTLDRRGYLAWAASGEAHTQDDFISERGPGYYGAELGFIHEVSKTYPSQKIVVIKWSLGGTGIDEWSPNWDVSNFPPRSRNAVIGSLYGKSMDAIKGVKSDGNFEYEALVWFQGENDALTAANANSYGEKLTRLIAGYRHDLNAPDLHVLVGRVNPISQKHKYVKEVQAQMEGVAASDQNVTVVAGDGLSKRADGIHYDEIGSVKMGERFGEAWVAITAKLNK